MKTFTWDELDCMVRVVNDPEEQRRIDEEGGWEYKETLPNGVVVFSTDRHIALQVHATDEDEAKLKFEGHAKYREMGEK